MLFTRRACLLSLTEILEELSRLRLFSLLEADREANQPGPLLR